MKGKECIEITSGLQERARGGESILYLLKPAGDPIAETIQFDAFAKLDLRIVRIVKADARGGADKLSQRTS